MYFLICYSKYSIKNTIYVCVPHFYDLSALVGCWSSFSIKRTIYTFLKCVSFWLHGCCGKWEGWALVTRYNHTSWDDCLICVSNFVSRMDRGLVEHFDEPAMNRFYRDFCASLESNKCMANRALPRWFVFRRKWEPIYDCLKPLMQKNL